MKKIITLSLLIALIHTTIHASQTTLTLYTWNEKIKNNLLENLSKYTQLEQSISTICAKPQMPQSDLSDSDYVRQLQLLEQSRAALEASLNNNCALKSYITLHNDIEKYHEPSHSLIAGARSLLFHALSHNEIRQEWIHAQKEALKIESATAQDIENAYDIFRKKLTQQLAAVTLTRTGIMCHPITDMPSRLNFLQPLANLSPEKCAALNQAMIAEYQIAPIIGQKVTGIMQSKTQKI